MRPVETSVTQKGQVTIPVEVRNRLGLKPRDRVVFELDGDTVPLRPASSTVRRHFGTVAPIQKPEDFASLRTAFEEGVAQEASAEDR